MTTPTTTMQELARRWVVDHDELALTEYCQREAARLDVEEMMTDATVPTTFEPDWKTISLAVFDATDLLFDVDRPDDAEIMSRAAITEYQRQMAAAGLVMADRSHVSWGLAQIQDQLNYQWKHFTDQQKYDLQSAFDTIWNEIGRIGDNQEDR